MAIVATHIVDTSAAARIREGGIADLLIPLITSGKVATCAQLDAEALYSARSFEEYERVRTDRRWAYEYLATNQSDWDRALDVRRDLARLAKLRTVGIPNLLIAAVTERHQVVVAHYDSDFDTIASITGQPTLWAASRGSVS